MGGAGTANIALLVPQKNLKSGNNVSDSASSLKNFTEILTEKAETRKVLSNEVKKEVSGIIEAMGRLAANKEPSENKMEGLKMLVKALKGVYQQVADENRENLTQGEKGNFLVQKGYTDFKQQDINLSFNIEGPYFNTDEGKEYPGLAKIVHSEGRRFSIAGETVEIMTILRTHYAKNHRLESETAGQITPGKDNSAFVGEILASLSDILNYSPEKRWEATSPIAWNRADLVMDACYKILDETGNRTIPYIKNGLADLADVFLTIASGNAGGNGNGSGGIGVSLPDHVDVQVGHNGTAKTAGCQGAVFTIPGKFEAVVAADPKTGTLHIGSNGAWKSLGIHTADGKEAGVLNVNVFYNEMMALALEMRAAAGNA